MPNINAALACAQLESIEVFLKNKRSLANDYKAFFETEGIKFRVENPGTKANYWLMAIELNNKSDRDLFLKTNSLGVMTRPLWQLMFRLPMFENCYLEDFQKNAIFLEERIVNIPSSFRKILIMNKIKPNLVLIGGGGHCVSVIDIIENENRFNIIKF